MIATINYAETFYGTTQSVPSRIKQMQEKNLSKWIGVTYDEPAFRNFSKSLEAVLNGKVYAPTAKKILNNWFVASEEQLQKAGKIQLLTPTANPVD